MLVLVLALGVLVGSSWQGVEVFAKDKLGVDILTDPAKELDEVVKCVTDQLFKLLLVGSLLHVR